MDIQLFDLLKTPQQLNWLYAALIRDGIKEKAEFETCYGVDTEYAERVLWAWEAAQLSKWDAQTLSRFLDPEIFPDRRLAILRVEAALPGRFAPETGLQWLEKERIPTGDLIDWVRQNRRNQPQATTSSPAPELAVGASDGTPRPDPERQAQDCTKGVLPKPTNHLAMFARLEPHMEWKGNRLAEIDLLTLEDAARFASKHSGTEITPGDFLRAAGRGEIPLRAIVHRRAKVQKHDGGIYCNAGQPDENVVPEGSIPTLPFTACKHLADTGRASWRTFDGLEKIDGNWHSYTMGQLTDDEPDFQTTPADCRVIGRDVHALADEYINAPAQNTATPAPLEPAKPPQAKPLQRTAAQDAAILCEITKQGYDPLALPRNPDGKPGVKAAIRTALSKHSLFKGSTIFNKAWERLTARADIAIQG